MAALFYLFQKHIGGQPLLPYEPRQRVPWGPVAAAIAAYIVLMRLFTVLMDTDGAAEKTIDPAEYIRNGWLNTIILLALMALGVVWLATLCKASRRDLGLPDSMRQLVGDVWIGVVACLASLLPLYLVQLTLVIILEPTSRHPLLEQLSESATPSMLLTAIGMAIVAAPLFEEFVFRLLLQGALERWEDEVLGYKATERQNPPPPQAGEEPGEGANKPEDDALAQTTHHPRPHHGLLRSLPHGWAPILASGLLFGIAHFGHGTAPVPLFLLGVVLGYVYQRTHRIVPCIMAHMVFNSCSLAITWLQ